MSDAYRETLFIGAAPERVFAHFVDPQLLLKWMGDWAALDPRPDGTFAVDINGVIIRGWYRVVEPPSRVVIAWGEAGNEEMPPGATTLTVTLTPVDGGTWLELVHSGLSPVEAGKHAVGWPHFLARLATASAGGDPGPDPWATAPLG